MSASSREFHERRIAEVLRHIEDHLDDPDHDLSVEALAAVAGFSKFHFHRQFSATLGVNVTELIGLMRLKRASLRLAFATQERIVTIALEAGFERPESFSRAFRRVQGQSPSQFRRAPEWERWAELFASPASPSPPAQPPLAMTIIQPELIPFPETKVAVLEHRGPPERLMASVARFIEWRRSSRDSPEATSQTYGVPYDDPGAVVPDAFRFDICGSVLASVTPNNHGVVDKRIPGGRCARVRHRGSTDRVGETVRRLYAEWLPHSGEQLRDFPCYFHYIARMPQVSEAEQITDVYLPLQDSPSA